MQKEFKETYFLSAGEANAEQEMSLPILTTKLIDIATAHANSLGIGNPAMKDFDGGWVLSRLTIEMNSYPVVNDTYCISTWIESFNRHFSERSFCISSPDGRIFGYAKSIWMVINTKDHTNLGLSLLNLDKDLVLGYGAPIDSQAKHRSIVESGDGVEIPKGAIAATHPVFDYRFKYCDLDFYRHVNTVRYVTLLLNRFSLEKHDQSFVKRLELSFMREAKYGMQTQLLRNDASVGDNEDSNTLSSFLLRETETASPLFFARLLRQRRDINQEN